MLTYNELRKNAKDILANNPSGDFKDKSFTCGSGGAPSNRLGVPEIHRANSFSYNTTANGSAYYGEVVIRCRKIGAKDVEGREIYEAENGELFVFSYSPGNPYSFDRGALVEPKLKE